MTTNNIQQCLIGFSTVEVIGGPHVVRVHEALDASYQHEKYRYFLSVDFKFRQLDAINIGKSGWLGCTKSEATRDAKALAAKIMSVTTALNAAKEQALQRDTATNRHTQLLQQQAMDRIIGRYCAEFIN